MFFKKMAALVATSLVLSTSPAVAQSSAAKLSPVSEAPRAGAEVEQASELAGGAGGIWVALIGVALLAAFVLVIIEDEDDLPDSP